MGVNILFKRRHALIAFAGVVSTVAVGIEVSAQSEGSLASIMSPVRVAVNSSFVSPLVELFGDVSIGKKSFVASNKQLRADPGTRICIGNETNLQDNIRFIATRNAAAPASECGQNLVVPKIESALPTKQLSKTQK